LFGQSIAAGVWAIAVADAVLSHGGLTIALLFVRSKVTEQCAVFAGQRAVHRATGG
jgi:hypothetical protein